MGVMGKSPVSWLSLFDNLVADLRYAVRTFRRNPVFTIGGVLTLALGIGANVAVFAFVNGLLLRPLPYPEPDRLVAIEETFPSEPGVGMPVSYLNFVDWHARQHAFAAIALYDDANMVLTGAGEAERVFGTRASAALFRGLGVSPALGRTFSPDEDRLGAPPVVVISHDLWQRRFAGEPVLGRGLVVDDVPRTIVGVMPPGFGFPDATALWIPAAIDPTEYPRGRHSFSCLARLKPGVTIADATTEMRAIAGQLAREYPADNEGVGVTLNALRGNLVPAQATLGFSLLMGTVGFVLLIACANLANLMLARAATRGQEMAVRVALGATRARLVRQSLTESGLLAASGAGLGLLAGALGRDALVALVPVNLPAWLKFEIDGTVAAFALLLAALTTMLVGLIPALRSSRPAVAPGLAASGVRVTGGRDWPRATLIASEVALAAVLLVGSGLMMRALATVLAIDPGLRAANVWSGRLAIPPVRYATANQQRAFYTQVLDQVRTLPGVRRASAVSSLPMSGSYTSRGVTIEGRPAAAPNEELLAVLCVALPDYFETLGIRVLRGRTFTDRDGLPGTLPVAIVNETFVRRYMPPGDPIGRRVSLGTGTDDEPWMTLVGVVADVRHESLDADADAGLFVPYNQRPVSSMTLVVRAHSASFTLTEPIRRIVSRIDRDRPLFAVRTLEQVMARSIWQSRLFTWLFVVFGGVALALASIGVYSVISYSVTQRTREIGLRLALGAGQGQIRWVVMRHGLALVCVGLAAGLTGATMVGRVLRSWLQGVSPTDPVTYAMVSFVLIAAASAACFVPSRRATRIDPMATLRGQ
jgi:putative ABC transport system permease protein